MRSREEIEEKRDEYRRAAKEAWYDNDMNDASHLYAIARTLDWVLGVQEPDYAALADWSMGI